MSLFKILALAFVVLILIRPELLQRASQGVFGGGGGYTPVSGGGGTGGGGGSGGPVPPGSAFTFNVGGDFRGAEPAQATAQNLVSDSPSVIFMTGDYAVNEGDADSWTNNIMSAVKNSGIPVYGALGNHDDDSYLSTGFFKNNSWSWSVKYGNIAFIGANTIDENVSETRSLIEAAQNDSSVAMIVILMHESVFRGENGDTSGSDADPSFHDVFKANSKVKFVIAGHSHNWAHYPYESIDYIILQDGGQESGVDDSAALHCSADANGNISCDMKTNGGSSIGSVSVSP